METSRSRSARLTRPPSSLSTTMATAPTSRRNSRTGSPARSRSARLSLPKRPREIPNSKSHLTDTYTHNTTHAHTHLDTLRLLVAQKREVAQHTSTLKHADATRCTGPHPQGLTESSVLGRPPQPESPMSPKPVKLPTNFKAINSFEPGTQG